MGALEYINCPLCDSQKNTKLFLGKDYLYSKEEFSVVKCHDCGLQYTNPCVKEDQIASYYYSGYSSRMNSKLPNFYKGEWGRLQRFFGNIHFTILELMRSINARKVLEIGPGNGRLLYFLKAQGYDVSGVELDSDLARNIWDMGIPCYCGNLDTVMDEIGGKKFDLIILCQTFEHLYDPKKTLKNIHSLLAEKGYLYMALPNSGSIEAKLFDKFWRGLDLPRHIVHYDKKTVGKILRKSGFDVLRQGDLIFPSSFVESIGFRYFQDAKMPPTLYYFLYYFLKLTGPVCRKLFGSGVMTVLAAKRQL
ncbi:MAG: class I SAM-dependent methyltransferase [Candidatus Aceula meridiana]|nr:class I SAM-dependent methyltransferase [Candidatus Aceula meridiana]